MLVAFILLLIEDELYAPYLTLLVADALGADIVADLVEDEITVDSVDAAFEVEVADFSGDQYEASHTLLIAWRSTSRRTGRTTSRQTLRIVLISIFASPAGGTSRGSPPADTTTYSDQPGTLQCYSHIAD